MSAQQDEDPLLQYVALRRDLWKEHNWPLGSIVAQGCHAATAALWVSKESAETAEYCSSGNLDHMRKVVLEAPDEAQLLQIASKLQEAGIPHKLWIEQPENMPTALASAPQRKSVISPFFRKLKLCRG
ncbi:hypothetical protein M9434_001264 [Picochlorum sp. BPE23]|nr:hypothetical protein M9434_001264 [Picochlorum sp. BPE23]